METTEIVNKICTKCGVEKEITEFYEYCLSKDKHAYRCKSCYKSYKKNRYYRNKNYYKNTQLKFTYGISIVEYNKMLEKQNGVCAICGKSPVNNRMLSVDHCHITGKIRGLLCIGCNTVIGFYEQNKLTAIKIEEYLK